MICCVTGHRPKGFPFPYEEKGIEYELYRDILHTEVKRLLREGYRDFITGMADGADLDFAYSVLNYRETEGFITLEAALPYPMRAKKNYTEYDEDRLHIWTKADWKCTVSPYYHKGCMQKRNCYMVDKADMILAIWNGKHAGGTWNTIRYAMQKEKKIHYIMLNDICRLLT